VSAWTKREKLHKTLIPKRNFETPKTLTYTDIEAGKKEIHILLLSPQNPGNHFGQKTKEGFGRGAEKGSA